MISIATASREQNEFLERCARSVADQGLAVQHVIQDTGAARTIADRLRALPGVQLTCEPDDGMYDALNRAFGQFRGDICGWLNADEQYLSGALAEVARFFDEHPRTDVLVGDALLVDEFGRPLCVRQAVIPPRFCLPFTVLPFLSCAVFFRARVLSSSLRFTPENKVIGDYQFFHALRVRQFRWSHLPKPCSAFTFRVGSLGSSLPGRDELQAWRQTFWNPLGIRTRLARLWVHGARLWDRALAERAVDYAVYVPGVEGRRTFTVPQLTGRWITHLIPAHLADTRPQPEETRWL